MAILRKVHLWHGSPASLVRHVGIPLLFCSVVSRDHNTEQALLNASRASGVLEDNYINLFSCHK